MISRLLSFCLRALLYCFTFIKSHYEILLSLHLIYAYFISKYISKIYDTRVMVYNMMPEKFKKYYSPFIRKEHSNIKKWQLILGAIYLLPIRFTLIWAELYTT